MKRMLLCMVFVLSGVIVNANDERVKTLLLKARTDQDDASGIRSANLDNKDIDDATFHTALTAAYNIVTLSVQYNKLQSPQPVRCAFLTMLNLSNGNIENFSLGNWVGAMPCLRELKLAHNNIRSIASDLDTVHTKCTEYLCELERRKRWCSKKLKTLDVSYNQLTEFDFNILNNAPNLTHADFSHNNITEVVAANYLEDRKICTVYLQANQLDDAKRQLLRTCNVCDTKEYGEKNGNNILLGGGIGTALGLGGVFGTVFSAHWHLAGVVFMAIGAQVIPIIAGGFIGHKAAQCAVPEDRRTYKPFILVFESDEDTDEVAVDLLES